MGLFSFLFGGTKKKQETKASSSTTAVNNPWAPAIPQLQGLLENTRALYDQTPMFDKRELDAYDYLFQQAGKGGADLEGAIAENNKTLRGEYLTPETNPFLADIARRISGIAGANVNSMFGGRGRTSGGLSGYYAGKGTADSLTDLYGQNYAAERGRQQQAVGMAPALANSRLDPAEAMVAAGREISDRPFQRNAMQAGILGSIAGLGGTTTSDTKATEATYGKSNGLLGSILNATLNRVFGTGFGTGG